MKTRYLCIFPSPQARRNREIAVLQRKIDEVPSRAELTQYQKRFIELYSQGMYIKQKCATEGHAMKECNHIISLWCMTRAPANSAVFKGHLTFTLYAPIFKAL